MTENKRKYELTLILENKGVEETKNQFTNLADEISKQGIEITNKEEWGLKRLFHPINKKIDGVFFFINFNASPELINIINNDFRVNSIILKYFIKKIK